jgi:Trypsin-co-occurring domain 2
MNEPQPGTPLADWIRGVRWQLYEAQRRFVEDIADGRESGVPGEPQAEFGLGLEEVTLEAQITSESTTDSSVGAKLFVIEGTLKDAAKQQSTQKIVLKFKPSSLEGKTPLLGDVHDSDAFADR